MSATREAESETGEAAAVDRADARATGSERGAFRIRQRGPEPIKPRKARLSGIRASAVHALEQRQLFVLLPFAIIFGLVGSLVASSPPEPIALIAVGVAVVLLLWLVRRSIIALRILAVFAAFWTGFCLLAIHGALFGTPMLYGSVYGTYQARVDGVVAVAETGRRVIISDITPVAPARPVAFRRARIVIKSGPPLAPGDIIEGPIRFYAVPGPAVPNSYDSEFHSYFDGIGAYGDASKTVTLVTPGSPAAPRRGEAMHTDIWYDLAIRELSDLSDPATEKLVEAAAENLPVPVANDEEPTPADAKAAGAAKTPAHPHTPARG